MTEKTFMYCKGSERMKLCSSCIHNYYNNKEKIDKMASNKNINLHKIDDTECEKGYAKFFSPKHEN